MQRRIITTLLSALLIIASANAQAASDMKLTDLITKISSDCFDYRIENLVIRMGIGGTPPRLKTALSLEVSYYQPDAIVMMYSKLGDEPWHEWRNTFGKVLKKIESPIIKLFFGADANGGATVAPWQAATASRFIYKYVDVISSPWPFLLNSLSTDRYNFLKYYGSQTNLADEFAQNFKSAQAQDVEQSQDEDEDEKEKSGIREQIQAKAKQYLDSVKDKIELVKTILNASSSDIKDAVSKAAFEAVKSYSGVGGDMLKVLEQLGQLQDLPMKLLKKIQPAIEFIRNMSRMFGGSGSGDMNPLSDQFNIFCPSSIAPFDINFISAVNPIGWRLGLPDILSTKAWNSFDKNQLVGNNLMDYWGRIFPRTGFVNSINDNKASAVLAMRAMHIVTERNQKFIYKELLGNKYLRHEHVKHSKVQMLHPVKSKTCARFINHDENKRNIDIPAGWRTSINDNPRKRYVYQYWRKYQCELNPVYMRFFTVYVGIKVQPPSL